MVALNVDIWSQAGVWHWAPSSSKGTHSTETDTLEVTSSCEEVVDMVIFSSTRPARDGSVATPQRCSRLAATTRRRRRRRVEAARTPSTRLS
jgi:hypothetical protein